MTSVAINPSSRLLGSVNAVLNGRARHYSEPRFAGPLSVRMVIAGQATWETGDGRFELSPGSTLLLNEGEEYSVTIDSLQPVETFCFFFAGGFVEDAYRATTTGSAALLDAPNEVPRLSFDEKLSFDSRLVHLLLRAHRRQDELAESFHGVALELASMQGKAAARIAKLPVLRASTRGELARRLHVATAYLHANSTRGVTVAEAARAACLSPFHFHRLFTCYHGMTPHRYLTRLRLGRARVLLREPGRNVLEVATRCGFESLGSFTELFKRTFNVTPGGLKKQVSRSGDTAPGHTMDS